MDVHEIVRGVRFERYREPIPLVPPLAPTECYPNFATNSYIALVACDRSTRFLVKLKCLCFYSKMAETVLMSSPDTFDELPLDAECARPELVQRLATWLHRHESVRVSKISIPLPRLPTIDDYYTDPWDLAFIRLHFVGEDEDMRKCSLLYDFALLAIYLQIRPLAEALAAFFAFQIKKGCRETLNPTQVVAGWYGRDARMYNAQDVIAMTSLVRETLEGLPLPRRHTMESDDEFTVPPCQNTQHESPLLMGSSPLSPAGSWKLASSPIDT